MIKMKYSQVSNYGFMQAVQRLAGLQLHAKAVYSLKKIVDDLNAKKKVIADEYDADILEKFATRDEKGVIIRSDDGGFTPKEELSDEFHKAQEAFGEREFTINREKLHLAMLGDARLSVNELNVIEPLFSDPEVIPAEGNVRSISGPNIA